MVYRRILAAVIIGLAALLAVFDFSAYRPFRLGLDLSGGSHLVYEADTTALPVDSDSDVADAMSSLREVIERRINAFGVAEPVIQTETVGLGGNARHRLIVELPGVTDLEEAIKLIDITPVLEFRTEQSVPPKDSSLEPELMFVSSPLTGRYLKRARVEFSQQTLGPSISLEFNSEGAKLFAELTKNNVGKRVAIYLDGQPLSAPVVQEEIKDGQAEITGEFTLTEAKELVRNLNLGALPVPIKLILTETVGAILGQEALGKGIRAGLIGLAAVAFFMILWYRLSGLVAIISLAIYAALLLAIFKLLPVTLTAAGVAGLIMSFGMALDANILIFERLKEEMRSGRHLHEAIREGFARAWLSVRDSNVSSLISGVVLFWFGTSLIKGFALTLSLGIIVSMFTAITVTRNLLLSIAPNHKSRLVHLLFGSGFNN